MSETPLLTDAEHQAMQMTADLWNHLVQNVVGDGESQSGDLVELCAYIHGIQHSIMGQAAGRAYPKMYRLLGETL